MFEYIQCPTIKTSRHHWKQVIQHFNDHMVIVAFTIMMSLRFKHLLMAILALRARVPWTLLLTSIMTRLMKGIHFIGTAGTMTKVAKGSFDFSHI